MACKGSIKDVLRHNPSIHKSSATRSTLQANSIVASMEPDLARVGDFFPAKLAITFGMAQFLCGALIIVFSSLSMMMSAGMSNVGAGLWAGTVVIVSGILGIMAGKQSKCAVYLVAFLCLAIISLAVSGLLVVFSTMGLIQDQNHPHGFYVDDQGNKIEFLGTVPLKSPAIAMNTVLVVLGTLSMLLAIGSSIICGREACQCYVLEQDIGEDVVAGVDTMIRRHRIITWLGDQEIGGSSITVPRNEHKVHPISTRHIPRIASCHNLESAKFNYQSKRNISPTSSSSTVKTELENDSAFAKGHFVSLDEHVFRDKNGKSKIPKPDY